jgi:hypothetical protein
MNWLRLKVLRRLASRRAKAALLLGLFLSVLGVATSATLHQAIHPNANQADHHCAATLLASGHVDAAATATLLPAVLLVPVVANRFKISCPTIPSFNLPLSRGPPALLS